nr:molecular chaperone TorD family protein [Gordonibacter urolithinfaciens]
MSRAYLYTLFHKLLGAAPDAAALDALLGRETAEVAGAYAEDDATMRGFGRFLQGLAAREDRAALLDEARDEHVRLFVGPGPLPAFSWESPYRTHEPSLFQESTLAVRAAYRAHGLEPKRLARVPDDHAALLCAFLARRSGVALAALRSGDANGLAVELRDEEAFAAAHLTSWLDAFAQAARRSRTAVLYPQLIEALAAFARVDAVFLAEAAYWAEGLAAEGAVGAPDVRRGSVEARALEAAREALAALEALRPYGIEDYELVPARSCAGTR